MVICNMKYNENRKIIFFLILLISYSFSLFAQDDILNEIYLDLIEKYDSIKTYEADFIQENFWKEIDAAKTSYGKIYYDSSFLLLEYSEPEGQKLLIDSLSVTIYDAASNQVLISNKNDYEIKPISIISAYWQNSQKELIENTENGTQIKLITPDNEQIFVLIKDDLIIEIQLLDNSENMVKYSFSAEKTNKPILQIIFELNLPEDVNVIDNR